jgi:methylated-DNA-[protein]-cysteine S-methyltransferase
MPTALSPITPILKLPVCVLGVRWAESAIEEILFLPPGTPLQATQHALGDLFHREIAHYLAQPGYLMTLPLLKRGTAFQNRVWAEISATPAGRTCTYGDIAQRLESAPRAVGQACGANPFPVVVPCHRVVGKLSLGGFAKQTTDWLIQTKQWLLAHEAGN